MNKVLKWFAGLRTSAKLYLPGIGMTMIAAQTNGPIDADLTIAGIGLLIAAAFTRIGEL